MDRLDSGGAGLLGQAASLGFRGRKQLRPRNAAGGGAVIENHRGAIAHLSEIDIRRVRMGSGICERPGGFKRSLVPVRVEPSDPGGLLKAIVHIDLVGLDEDEARERLLGRLSGGRSKPSKKPAFPGGGEPTQTKEAPPFPGRGVSASTTKATARYMPKIRKSPTDLEKRRFIETCFDTVVRHFKDALAELSTQDAEIEGELKEINATKYVAEIYVNGKKSAHCKFWLGDRMGGDGIAYSETDFGWDDNSFNEMLSLVRDELALTPLMGDFGGRAGEGLNLEHLTPEQAAEYLWRRFTSRLAKEG
jgi:hypothetical protein